MAALDYAANIVAPFFALLKTDLGSASVAVRAALGAGAGSVISADALGGALPARPFGALRAGVVTGSPGWDVLRATLTWWVYDDARYQFSRINPLLGLVQAVYAADEIVIPYCSHRQLAITAERPDAALGGRPARAIPYVVSWR